VTWSVADAQLRTLTTWPAPPPVLDTIRIGTVASGGVVAGITRSAPLMKGRANNSGMGAARLVTPSTPSSKANMALTRLTRGASAGVARFVPATSRTSLWAPWSPHHSLYRVTVRLVVWSLWSRTRSIPVPGSDVSRRTKWSLRRNGGM
jgi:hypothetical protein